MATRRGATRKARVEEQRAEDGGGHRHAVGVDARLAGQARSRLRKIEGQVRGIGRMVDDERYCADILMQIASVQQALRGVARLLMRNHLEHCVTDALKSGDPVAAERAYDEVLELMYRHAK